MKSPRGFTYFVLIYSVVRTNLCRNFYLQILLIVHVIVHGILHVRSLNNVTDCVWMRLRLHSKTNNLYAAHNLLQNSELLHNNRLGIVKQRIAKHRVTAGHASGIASRYQNHGFLSFVFGVEHSPYRDSFSRLR